MTSTYMNLFGLLSCIVLQLGFELLACQKLIARSCAVHNQHVYHCSFPVVDQAVQKS
jgi:hypothetical protein